MFPSCLFMNVCCTTITPILFTRYISKSPFLLFVPALPFILICGIWLDQGEVPEFKLPDNSVEVLVKSHPIPRSPWGIDLSPMDGRIQILWSLSRLQLIHSSSKVAGHVIFLGHSSFRCSAVLSEAVHIEPISEGYSSTLHFVIWKKHMKWWCLSGVWAIRLVKGERE